MGLACSSTCGKPQLDSYYCQRSRSRYSYPETCLCPNYCGYLHDSVYTGAWSWLALWAVWHPFGLCFIDWNVNQKSKALSAPDPRLDIADHFTPQHLLGIRCHMSESAWPLSLHLPFRASSVLVRDVVGPANSYACTDVSASSVLGRDVVGPANSCAVFVWYGFLSILPISSEIFKLAWWTPFLYVQVSAHSTLGYSITHSSVTLSLHDHSQTLSQLLKEISSSTQKAFLKKKIIYPRWYA